MYELVAAIPDAQVLLGLEPEELGAKMLFVLRKRQERTRQTHGALHLSNILSDLWPESYLPNQTTAYPRELKSEIDLAISEAWSWLTAQGLLVSQGIPGGSTGLVLSRTAARFEDEKDVANFAVARLLQKDVLHPRLADKVWSAFMRNEYEVAAFQAMKAVEVSVREASGLPASLLGVPLMRKAFHPDNGQLTDLAAEAGERDARASLFVGAIGCLQKSPFPS